MSEKSNIAWTDSTLNPWFGCRRKSAGCQNCYIERTLPLRALNYKLGQLRIKSKGFVKAALAMNRKPWICDECGSAEIHTVANHNQCDDLGEPAKANFCVCGSMSLHRRRIFSLSLGDWLDDEVPIEWLAEMLDTIRQCDQCAWLLCTKRPENWKSRLTDVCRLIENKGTPTKKGDDLWKWTLDWLTPQCHQDIPRNIVLLASVENQEQADKRIPQLLAIPAACRGLSLEPLLGPVDLRCVGAAKVDGGKFGVDYLAKDCQHVDWLIIGGESGPHRRHCKMEWIESLVAQGRSANVATFVKQIHYEDGSLINDVAQFPSDLRIQQWPKGF